MQTAVRSANGNPASNDAALVGLVSAVACAAAGSWLGFSILSRKRRMPVAGQLLLGVLAGCAGVVTWKKRQAEMEAAHNLIDHVHEVRDARWLKKHPVAYG
jgi:high-affinity Fe2+/Pb2+ permease